MSFDDLIPFALVLIPGTLAQYFYEKLRPVDTVDSDFMRMFYGFLHGWPVLLGNWLVVRWYFNLTTLATAAEQFNNPWFYVLYFISSFLFAFLWTIGRVALQSGADDIFAWLQELLGQPNVVLEQPWDKLFYSDHIQVVEVITPDGQKSKGFVDIASIRDSEPKEITLKDLDIVETYDSCFQTVKRVYVNADSGTVIREFDVSAYEDLVKTSQEERS